MPAVKGSITPAPAGWYFDPSVAQQRWWDGHAWADQVLADTEPGWGAHVSPTFFAPVTLGTSGGRGQPGHAHAAAVAGRHGAAASPGAGSVRRAVEGAVSAVAAVVLLLILVTIGRNWASQDASTEPGAQGSSTSATPASTSSGEELEILASNSATGNAQLDPFTTAGPWQLQYSFDCGNIGRAAAFVVTDSGKTLVRARGRSGFRVVTSTGSGRHVVSVATRCGWVVRVFGSPG